MVINNYSKNIAIILIFISQTIELFAGKGTPHPLAVACAQIVYLLHQQEPLATPIFMTKVASIPCTRQDAIIFTALNKQAYKHDAARWCIKNDESDTTQSFLELYKNYKVTKLPSVSNLIQAYDRVIRSLGEGWVEVNPSARKDIDLYDKPSKYRVFIKDEAFEHEDDLITQVAEKYAVANVQSSNMFRNEDRRTYTSYTSYPDRTTIIYLTVTKKNFKKMLKNLSINFVIQQGKCY